MRIVVNTRFLLQGKLEGIGWFSHEILRRMVSQHPDDDFFFLFDRPYDPAFVFEKNVTPVVVFPPARHPLLWFAWFEIAVPRVLKRLKADVFISTDGYCSLSTAVPTLMFWHDASYLFEPQHIGFTTRQYYRYFVPKFLRRANRLITFSQSARNDLVEYFAVPATKISTSTGAARSAFVPLLMSEQELVREQWTGGNPYFLFVGAIHPRKNVQRLIRAFDTFKQQYPSRIQLLLAGRFAWKTGAVRQAYEHSVHHKDIRFVGHLDQPALTKLVASAYCLVYPSLYEGFGLPVLEAIQCGVPVITSNISSMPEVAGNAGLLIDPLDETSLVEAMRLITSDLEMHAEMVAQCAAQAAKFDWDSTARDVYDALTSTLLTASRSF